jgi:16S rRNA (cytidine1402-2'-O)-methyltransferase
VLYIVPTPIGNLKDITYRAVEVLSACDYILCEDTRHSSILLNHYSIKKPLKSYHQFNESSKLSHILDDLRSGQDIAIISDGGTPGICDPGAVLIKACRDEGLSMTALPGASAVTCAFSLWGADSPDFQFLGFFPRKEKEAHQFLLKLLHYDGISLFYESPQRIQDTLKILVEFAPERKLLITRELSKTFEEKLSGTASVLLEHFQTRPPKGEFVVLVDKYENNTFEGLSVSELLAVLQDTYSLTLTDAIKTAAHIRKEPKQSIYKWVHEES